MIISDWEESKIFECYDYTYYAVLKTISENKVIAVIWKDKDSILFKWRFNYYDQDHYIGFEIGTDCSIEDCKEQISKFLKKFEIEKAPQKTKCFW